MWGPVLEDSRSVSWAYQGCPAPALSGVLTLGPCTHPQLQETEPLPASAGIFKLAAQLFSDQYLGFSWSQVHYLLSLFLPSLFPFLTEMLFLWKCLVCPICSVLVFMGLPCHLLFSILSGLFWFCCLVDFRWGLGDWKIMLLPPTTCYICVEFCCLMIAFKFWQCLICSYIDYKDPHE